MLKRTMICAFTLSMAQSLTLLAQSEGESESLENSELELQTEDLIAQQEAGVDQVDSSESSETFPDAEPASIDDAVILEPLAQADGLEPAIQFEQPVSDTNVESETVADDAAQQLSELPKQTVDVTPAQDVAEDIAVTDEPEQTDVIAEPAGETAEQTDEILTAQAQPSVDENATLNEQVQSLKQQVLELNKDLFILEEELLFPANTQVAVYLSVNVGEFFQLDAVKLTIDDKVVTNYLYTSRQVNALHRGGVQRLYLGNLKTGDHEIVAVFTGRGPKKRDYRRATTLQIDKTSQAKQIELKIVDSTAAQQPEFVVKEW
jgi:hypothetical protein